MRQLIVMVPRGHGDRVLAVAKENQAVNTALVESRDGDGPREMVIMYVPNDRAGDVIDALGSVPDMHVTLVPRGDLTLYPPPDEAPDQATDVASLSPIEVYLAGLQAKGSWIGFIGYAMAAGAVVWIGLRTDTVFLLTAAMLIAPFAGPAMNMAIGTARGDWALIRHSLTRYGVGLSITAAVAWLLTLLLHPAVLTSSMKQTTALDSTAVLLPLVAGAAGALNLLSSDRSSLVSGAATGMLVAASLAPPVGVLGMAIAIGEWSLLNNAGFVLLLQLVGINLSAGAVFWLHGLTPKGIRFPDGARWIRNATLATSAVALAALLTWQFSTPIDMNRDAVATRIRQEVQTLVRQDATAHLLDMRVRFADGPVPGRQALIVEAYVQASEGADPAAVKQQVQATLRRAIAERHPTINPMVTVTAFEAP